MRLRAEGWNGSGPPLRLLQSSSSHGLPSVSSPGLSFGLLTSLMCRVVAVVVILTMVFVPTEQLTGFNGGKWFSFPTELSVLLLSVFTSSFHPVSLSFCFSLLSFFLSFLFPLISFHSFFPSFFLSFFHSFFRAFFLSIFVVLVHFVGL